jgi:flagellar basal-body rod modification protein FlgD
MEINITSAPTTSLSPTSTENSVATDVVSKDAFLKLLVAQLEHQDPLSPMENVEFTSQLAQFSTLEQIEKVNTTLSTLVSMQGAANTSQVANFIGKEIKGEGNTIRMQAGETAPLQYTLSAHSASAAISIVDESGNLIRTVEVGEQEAGQQVVTWDGRNVQGNAVPDGLYRFSVIAQDRAGNVVSAETVMQGIVDGVEYDDNEPFLLVNGSRVALTSVLSVHREE